MLKQIIVPMAAFAITATSASAFTGSEVLQNRNIALDLTTEQTSALEEIKNIRLQANEDIKKLFENAGIDKEKIKAIHEAKREGRKEKGDAVRKAVGEGDYEAFKIAIADLPLAIKITSESKFEELQQAHELLFAGDREKAEAIFASLGLERRVGESSHRTRLDNVDDAE